MCAGGRTVHGEALDRHARREGELQHTCHLIGSEEKHLMYLCATPSGDGFTECLPSTDFSAYYGHDVYICKGGPPPRDLVAARE